MEVHFLQTAAWQAFQEARGRTVYLREGDGWHYRAILEPGTRLSPARLYCPYGPTATSERSLKTALESLRALAQSTGACFVRVEPIGVKITPKKLGLLEVDYSQPSHTWQIDLSQPKEDLLAAMKQNTRNIYKNYHKKGLSYRQSSDPTEVKHLLSFLQEVASHNNITVHNDSYLTLQTETLLPIQAGLLHFIEFEGSPIAAALTYEDETISYYAHAGASHEHRKLSASTALLAEIIMHAKEAGKTTCDLYGITTSGDPQHRWAGFTRFKKSFGGHEVTLSPTYDLPIKRAQYRAYAASRSSIKTARKMKQLLLATGR